MMGCHLFMTLLYRLLFPIIMFFHFLRWIMNNNHQQCTLIDYEARSATLITLPDFSMTGCFVLSHVFLMNHMFVTLLEGFRDIGGEDRVSLDFFLVLVSIL